MSEFLVADSSNVRFLPRRIRQIPGLHPTWQASNFLFTRLAASRNRRISRRAPVRSDRSSPTRAAQPSAAPSHVLAIKRTLLAG